MEYIKLVSADYYNDCGKSFAIVKCHDKIGHGKARLHPEDAGSEFFGCKLADIRAQIDVLKKIYKEKRKACDECKKFVKALEQYKNWNASEEPSKDIKIVYRQLNKRIKEVNQLADQITALELEEKTQIKAREIVMRYINNKKSKEDNQSE